MPGFMSVPAEAVPEPQLATHAKPASSSASKHCQNGKQTANKQNQSIIHSPFHFIDDQVADGRRQKAEAV